jgi:calcineurin-like phosphoesterase family protein
MTIWLTSDTHFGHANIIRFTGTDGQLIRPGFSSVEEMNETLIERWNAVVRPTDHVYHLGDVAMKIPGAGMIAIVRRLHGHKRLVLGNHDRFSMQQYREAGFEKVFGMHRLFNVWLTHAPLHPGSIGSAIGNAHGHIHEKLSPLGPYANVCVERRGFAPVPLELIREEISRRSAPAFSPVREDDPCLMALNALRPFSNRVHEDGVDAPFPESLWGPQLEAARAARVALRRLLKV